MANKAKNNLVFSCKNTESKGLSLNDANQSGLGVFYKLGGSM